MTDGGAAINFWARKAPCGGSWRAPAGEYQPFSNRLKTLKVPITRWVPTPLGCLGDSKCPSVAGLIVISTVYAPNNKCWVFLKHDWRRSTTGLWLDTFSPPTPSSPSYLHSRDPPIGFFFCNIWNPNVAKIFRTFATWTLQHFRKHPNPCNIDIATFTKFFKILATFFCNNY